MSDLSVHILLIADDPVFTPALKTLLDHRSTSLWSLQYLKSLKDFHTHFTEMTVDILILDWADQRRYGTETITRALDIAPHLPIIVLADSDNDQLATEAVQLGAQDYLVKDRLHSEMLIRVIRYAIERKRTHDSIRQSEMRYQQMIENAIYGIYRATSDGRWLYANPALATMLGYESTKELMDATTVLDLYQKSDDRERLIAQIITEGRLTDFEVDWKRKDGTTITVQLSGRSVMNPETRETEAETIVEDITERRSLEDQLHQAYKMEAIGQLAGGVAHDFNNLLTVITGNAYLLLLSMEDENPLREHVDEIRAAGERASSVTEHLLTFSRKQVTHPEPIVLNTVITESMKILRRLIRTDIDIETVFDSELDMVMADVGQIEQILMNLVINARDAMPGGGKIVLETANRYLNKEVAQQYARISPGNYVTLSIRDTGVGMDKETQDRIFEPFFTTKPSEEGTGLGLSTVYGIVEQSEGRILVDSEPDVGTTFTIYLPPFKDECHDFTSEERDLVMPCGTETVMVVEDEEFVRQLMCDVLSMQGYTVLTATNGFEALEVYEKNHQIIDLIITDVVMPKMNGCELIKRLQVQNPDMKALYITGYASKTLMQYGIENTDISLIQKPFTPIILGHKIREMLEVVS